MARLHIVIALAVLSVLFTGCASKNDNSEAAKAIAQQWISSNIDSVSDKLANVISKDYPMIASFALKAAIRSSISWGYDAYQVKTDRWQVIVTGKIDTSIPVIEKAIKVSGTFPLVVNTETSSVVSFDFDPSSFKFSLTDIGTSSSALAKNRTWVKVHSDEETDYWAGFSSSKKDGDIVNRIAYMKDYKTPQTLDDGKQYLSAGASVSCNCATGQYQIPVIGFFSGQRGKGDTIFSVQTDDWKSFSSPTQVLKAVCDKAC